MRGQMMDYPLTLTHVLDRARQLYGRKEIVTKAGPTLARYTYAEMTERVGRLANALEKLGVRRGDRVATFAWNNARHMELYLAVPCMGAVLHPLNLRLPGDQLMYIANHADDQVIFVDTSLLPAVEKLAPHLKCVKHYVVMGDEVPADCKLESVYAYEELLSTASPDYHRDGRFVRDMRTRCLPPGGADVSRLSLGHTLCLRHGRRQGCFSRPALTAA